MSSKNNNNGTNGDGPHREEANTITLGSAAVSIPFIPVPNKPQFYYQYINFHAEVAIPLIEEGARLLDRSTSTSTKGDSGSCSSKPRLVTVESNAHELTYLLRALYKRKVEVVSRHLRPDLATTQPKLLVADDSGPGTAQQIGQSFDIPPHYARHSFTTLAASTVGRPTTLYCEKGLGKRRQIANERRERGEDLEHVYFFDCVTTSGRTIKAAAELLLAEGVIIDKAFVLFKESWVSAEEEEYTTGGPALLRQPSGEEYIVVSDEYHIPLVVFVDLPVRSYKEIQGRGSEKTSEEFSSRQGKTAAAVPVSDSDEDDREDEQEEDSNACTGRCSSQSNAKGSQGGSTAVQHVAHTSPPLYHLYSAAVIPTYYGDVHFSVFTSAGGQLAVCVTGKKGDIDRSQPVLVRVHDACLTSECFRSCKCDCREQLELALALIQTEGGMVIYLLQEGRGIGLAAKIAAYALQQTHKLDTVDANRALGLPDDLRTYEAARDILTYYSINNIVLLSNNPRKVQHLRQLGIQVVSTRPILIPPESEFCRQYLAAKKERMEHHIPSDIIVQQQSPSLLTASAGSGSDTGTAAVCNGNTEGTATHDGQQNGNGPTSTTLCSPLPSPASPLA